MIRQPSSLARDISPPPSRARRIPAEPPEEVESTQLADDRRDQRLAARIEAGEVQVRDHLTFFAHRLEACSRSTGPDVERIGIDHFRRLYERNSHAHGRHFVVHQHDHPISGVHYDLRLQFSDTSSISFAIPYGMPGNPNSMRPNRMAIETRVHCIWNNLIESASHATGSLLIWDTGEYEIVEPPVNEPLTDGEQSDDEPSNKESLSHSQKLFVAFQDRHIKLRLHGAKVPEGYTVSLRLPLANNYSMQPKRPKRKRRKVDPSTIAKTRNAETDSEGESTPTSVPGTPEEEQGDAAADASGDDEDASIRENNAYPGAHNTIGSVHQRHWFLTLDKTLSGFRKVRTGPDRGQWKGSSQPFFVRGRDHERSVITGRTADEVLEDEGVKKFSGRKMWRPILE